MSAPRRNRLEPGIYERLDAHGRRLGLELQYKDAGGRPRRRSVDGDIHAARDALAEARTRRAKREREPSDPRATLNHVIDAFEAAHVATLRANSREAYTSSLTRIRSHLGHKRITAIVRADIRRFIAREIEEGLKANTIRLHYSALRKLFTFAREDLDIPVTFPRLKPTELPDPADDRREHRILSDDELTAVLSASPERARLYLRTVAETGCRASEALGLTPRDIGDGTITFTRQLARDGSLRPLKTRQSKRTIEITRGLSAQLRLSAGGHTRVFWGLPSVRVAEHQLTAALDQAGLEHPRPVLHDLRHTHASKLIAAGWDPVEVAKRLGDKIQTVLQTYAHQFDARRRSAERRHALEQMYGEMATEMATSTPSQTVTDGAKVQRLRTHRNTA